MAISFTCPFCNEAYNNLKEELIGKRVTCRNLNCRKIFVVTPKVPVGAVAPSAATGAEAPSAPKPGARQPIKPIPKPNAPAAPIDAEAIALAAFAEEAKKPEVEVKKITVVCTICEHKFEVDREMEGRNVPCPECRKLIKVPLLKKEEAVDWRKTDNREHLKRNEPVLEGVTEKKNVSAEALIQAGAVPKIEYEPLPLATKIKRFLIVFILVGGMAFGISYLLKSRNQKSENKNVTEAIKAIDDGEESKTRSDLQAGIYRLAAEERLRTATNKADLDEAIKFLNTARERVLKAGDHYHDRQAELVEIAVTFCSLGGDANELKQDIRLKWDDVQKQIRQTLEKVNDPELKLQGLRKVARKLAEKREAWRCIDIAHQIFPPGDLPEIAGQIGLELLKMGQKELATEFLKKKVGPMIAGIVPPPTSGSLDGFRIALGTLDEPAPLNNLKVLPRAPAGVPDENARIAWVEGLAFAGDYKAAAELANRPGNFDARVRAFLAAGEKALIDNAKEPAQQLLEGARVMLMRERKSATLSPWVRVQAVYLIARAGKHEQANELVETLDKELQPWARVELLRGRLQAATAEPPQEDWLPAVPENTKPRLSHAIAQELYSRHQSANGLSIPVDTLSPMLKPFAQLGTLLGSQNRGTAP